MILQERRTARRQGFTLMEMLVVVAIIVVLAGAGGVIYFNQLESSKEDLARSKAKTTLQTAVESYALKHGSPPESLQELVAAGTLDQEAILDPWNQPYRYDPSGNMNGGRHPDIYCEHNGKILGNVPNSQ